MFVKIANGEVDKYPYSIEDLRRDNPNTSFPKNISDNLLTEFNVFSVGYEPAPEFNPTTHRIETSDQPVLKDDKWVLTKTLIAKTQEQISVDTINKETEVRSDRDRLLAKTDWLVIRAAETGEAIPENWVSYRQALRDITNQEGFPHNITWPAKPT